MKLATITMRLAALAVLFTSISDYWAYDRWDPTAPMNSPGAEELAVVASHGAPPLVRSYSADLPDDQCLCCSPLVAPAAPVLPLPGINSAIDRLIFPTRSAPLKTLDAGASLPPRDSTGFERPLRV